MKHVTYERKKTSHGFHLLMSFLTLGMWAVFVWPLVWVWNAFGPRKRTVTYTYGQQAHPVVYAPPPPIYPAPQQFQPQPQQFPQFPNR